MTEEPSRRPRASQGLLSTRTPRRTGANGQSRPDSGKGHLGHLGLLGLLACFGALWGALNTILSEWTCGHQGDC